MNSFSPTPLPSTLRRWLIAITTGSAIVCGSFVAQPLGAIAQTRFSPQASQQTIAQSAAIRATSIQNQTLYLNNDRSYSYNLEVEQGATLNGLYIPPGSVIIGEYVPAPGGLQYIARAVDVGNRTYSISASSGVLEDVKDPRDTSAGAIAEDAGIGAAGGAVLGEIFGGIDAPEVIGGAAAGVITGNVTADRVVVVEPNEPIVLYSR